MSVSCLISKACARSGESTTFTCTFLLSIIGGFSSQSANAITDGPRSTETLITVSSVCACRQPEQQSMNSRKMYLIISRPL